MNMKKREVLYLFLFTIILISGCSSSEEQQKLEPIFEEPYIPTVDDNNLIQRAATENNKELCNQVKDFDIKNNCLDIFYMTRVQETKDLNLCNNIIDSKLKELCLQIEN
jgi:hypothetical protein